VQVDDAPPPVGDDVHDGGGHEGSAKYQLEAQTVGRDEGREACMEMAARVSGDNDHLPGAAVSSMQS